MTTTVSVDEVTPLTINKLLLNLPDKRDWITLALAFGEDVSKLQKKYADALDDFLDNPTRPMVQDLTDEGASNEKETKKTYSIPVVPGTLSVRVDVQIELEENWHGTVTITPVVFGKDFDKSTVQISRTQSYFEIHPSALLVKADLKIGLYGDKLCFGIEGQACYWAFGWKCERFSAQNLFCIK